MTISGWIIFGVISIFIVLGGISFIEDCCDTNIGKVIAFVIVILLIVLLLLCMLWYFGNTASGQRAITTQKSELQNGIDRTITVYTATGEVIAQYTGCIDLQCNDGGYVLFDFEGKRYTYYNCFVESIAIIDNR